MFYIFIIFLISIYQILLEIIIKEPKIEINACGNPKNFNYFVEIIKKHDIKHFSFIFEKGK